MPHCVIEYAEELATPEQIKQTVKEVNTILENCGLFTKPTIKTRAIPVASYLIGGEDNPFIHVTIKMLAGRTTEKKAALSESVLHYLIENFDIDSLSVEALDLSECYSKR